MKRIYLFLGAAAVSAAVGGVVSYAVVRHANPEARRIEFAGQTAGSHFTAYQHDNYPDLTYAAENCVKAVVNIEKTEEMRSGGMRSYDPFLEFFGIPQGYQQEPSTRERRSGGSGVIISTDGYIVTNNHVVENAAKLKVKLNDGRTFPARLIGTDPTTDVALIKVDATDLPTLAFGDSDALRLGEWVLAIGSPFDLQSTVTAGIVSAKSRSLNVIPSSVQSSIESFIQTDAAVNPGNSGGALVNVSGQLIGINTVIKSPTGTYTGYSFAVPSAIVQKVVVDLKEYGVVQRAMLGIGFREIDEQFLEEEGDDKKIAEEGGIYVASVDPDGAAAAAGIKTGDVITAISGVQTMTSGEFLEQMGRLRPGDNVKITAKRSGAVKQFDVVLRNKVGKAELLKKDYVDAAESLGGTFADLSEKGRKDLKLSGGVVVTGIKEGGILSKARVKRGYVITHLNDRKISSVADLAKITSKITAIDGVYPDGRAASYSLYEPEK